MSASTPRTSRTAGLLLGAALMAAAALRLTGLGWGLRHTPHIDERYFVENTAEMLSAGDLDHRYYPYPGLFFYLLASALAFLDPDRRTAPEAYLTARALVAFFGVASVALVYRLGVLVADRWAALVAAALLAVSPVAVHTAHMVRPDVALGAFALGAMLVFYEAGPGTRGDLACGAALGVVNAVKFSGVLLAPTWLLRRGQSLRAVAVGSIAAAVTFICLTPYSVLRFADFAQGARLQLQKNTEDAAASLSPGYFEMLSYYGLVWVRALGLAGALFAAAGAVLVARRWRTWLPLLAFPASTLLVIALSVRKYDRHMLASLGVPALLAGVTISGLARRSRLAGILAAVGCLAPPLAASVGYVRVVSRPGTRDRLIDHVERRLPPGARVLGSVEGLGLDRASYELLAVPRIDATRLRQVLEVDYLITTPLDDEGTLSGLPVIHSEQPQDPAEGPLLHLRRVPSDRRPPYRTVSLEGATFTASENASQAPAIGDDTLDTWWETLSPQTPGAWIRVDLPAARRLARLELFKGGPRRGGARQPVLEVSRDGVQWSVVGHLPARPPEASVAGTASRPASQVFVFGPVEARSLRIEQKGRAGWKWRVAGMRLDEMETSIDLTGRPRSESEP